MRLYISVYYITFCNERREITFSRLLSFAMKKKSRKNASHFLSLFSLSFLCCVETTFLGDPEETFFCRRHSEALFLARCPPLRNPPNPPWSSSSLRTRRRHRPTENEEKRSFVLSKRCSKRPSRVSSPCFVSTGYIERSTIRIQRRWRRCPSLDIIIFIATTRVAFRLREGAPRDSVAKAADWWTRWRTTCRERRRR